MRLDGVLKAVSKIGTSRSWEMSQVWRSLRELHGLPGATPLDVSSPNGASHEVYSRAFPAGLFLRAALLLRFGRAAVTGVVTLNPSEQETF